MVGVVFNHTVLTDEMLTLEDEDGNFLCQESNNSTCFLLDEGGFILSENLNTRDQSHVSVRRRQFLIKAIGLAGHSAKFLSA